MKRREIKLWVSLVLAALLAAPMLARATTAVEVGLEDLRKLSHSAFVGHVINVRTEGSIKPRSIKTIIQIEVDECLVGRCQSTVEITQLGGRFRFHDGIFTQHVPGTAEFNEGERVVVFLEMTDTKKLVVAGLAQGKFSVEGESDSAFISRKLNGLNLVKKLPNPVQYGAQSMAMPTRLDTLKASLRRNASIIDLRPIRTVEPSSALRIDPKTKGVAP